MEEIMYKILIVEDDPSIQEILHDFIQEAGYDITLASDGVEALTKFSESHFDLILLDIMLPKIDGYSVSEVIRKKSDIPIIMLTALDSEEAQIRGLDLMVDDYITKPFSLPILIRKIAVLLRRSKVQKKVQEMSEIIHYQNITLDVDAYKAYINNTLIELTPREFEILQELVTHPGKILSRQYLLSRIWKYDYFGDERVIDTHIKNLRKKLNNADYIETIRGVGYRIDKEDKK
jgi:two-component system response regulator VanR